MMKSLIIGAAAAAMLATSAQAASVLYRNDFNVGTDFMAAALATTGHTVTSTGGDLSGFSLSDYDVVVYATQNNGAPGDDILSLDNFIGSGGKVVFATWAFGNPSLGADQSGNQNLQTLTLGSAFSAGLGSTLNVVNTGWGTYSLGLTPTTGTVAATFENGDAGIVIGNGGRTIWNGFLTDTVNAPQLYVNQVNFLLDGGAGAVPEPTSWVMLITGFGIVGAAMRRRRITVAA